ncbi:hypothetical protein [Massilia sp. TS11]|uniref:hypothetical protein n=1 Tax=Massilia sp. TS11 TaxID=2908003 RepID=UPI001EDB04F7|nr:hypothetical protein [Massilia sp. TS11]MCG2583854.1 hypothetical protein [Massilia sp. TS11]
MDKAARVRWTVLGGALVATVAAIFYPTDDDSDGPVRQTRSPASAPPVPVKSAMGGDVSMEVEEDPFAPRGWQAPAPTPAPTPAPSPVALQAAATPPPPPPPPALPFRFLGRMSDGGEEQVYLGIGEQVFVARLGALLEGGYKVVAMKPQQIEFESSQGGRQSLPLPEPER